MPVQVIIILKFYDWEIRNHRQSTGQCPLDAGQDHDDDIIHVGVQLKGISSTPTIPTTKSRMTLAPNILNIYISVILLHIASSECDVQCGRSCSCLQYHWC